MCERQAHRGPDSRGLHLADGVGLGIQRLRVIDLETGDQPVYNEDRSVAVVLNGEIYNYRELRRELQERGHTLSTHGDSEVIAHLYEEEGDDLVERLDGMFAFALWDERRRRLLIGRDRVGKKPLFYAVRDGSLAFASELAALMADPSIPRELDPAALDVPRLRLRAGAGLDLARGAQAAARAHACLGGRRGADRALLAARLRSQDVGAAAAARRAAARAGRRRGAQADDRRRAARHVALRRRRLGGRRRGDGGRLEPAGEDLLDRLPPEGVRRAAAGAVTAERFGTEHQEFVVEPDAIEMVPKLVRHYGEPFADSSAIPSFYLAELTRGAVTVALNGDGGDESSPATCATSPTASAAGSTGCRAVCARRRDAGRAPAAARRRARDAQLRAALPDLDRRGRAGALRHHDCISAPAGWRLGSRASTTP